MLAACLYIPRERERGARERESGGQQVTSPLCSKPPQTLGHIGECGFFFRVPGGASRLVLVHHATGLKASTFDPRYILWTCLQVDPLNLEVASVRFYADDVSLECKVSIEDKASVEIASSCVERLNRVGILYFFSVFFISVKPRVESYKRL